MKKHVWRKLAHLPSLGSAGSGHVLPTAGVRHILSIDRTAAQVLKNRSEDAKFRKDRVKSLQQYRDPILTSAQNVQRLLYHVISKNGEVGETMPLFKVYQFATFFGWYRHMRVKAVFLDEGTEKINRELEETLTTIVTVLTCRSIYGCNHENAFRLSLGELDLLAEMLITDPHEPHIYLDYVMPYIGFRRHADQRVQQEGIRYRVFEKVNDMLSLNYAKDFKHAPDVIRLIRMQQELVTLIDILDPDGIRISRKDFKRKRLEPEDLGRLAIPLCDNGGVSVVRFK